MLEEQIKALAAMVAANTKAIEALTAALLANNASSAPLIAPAIITAPTVQAELAVDTEQTAESLDANTSRTLKLEKLKTLAKDKLAEGVSRKTIKAVITGFKVEQLSDLSDNDMLAVYDKISALRGE